MQLTVNGEAQHVPDAWRDETLLATLREYFGLVGAKYSCGIGVCGACTVHLDGAPVNSCRLRTSEAEGRRVLTIEGLGPPGGGLHPLQQAWLAERVAQCGYCQAGQIMRAAALLSRSPRPSRDEIDDALAGNLCRCGTYARIERAVLRASGQQEGGGKQDDG